MFSILLLDDEPDVLSSLRLALHRPLGGSATIHAFTDPYAALDHMDEHPVDLVMTDFRMPGMDGIQFLHFVRHLQPHAQRMIVSAATEVNTLISAIGQVGVFRYVVKPWNTATLVDDVRDALSEAAAWRERCHLEEFGPGLAPAEWEVDAEAAMPELVRRVH